ncbi:MAG TPA: HEAT repeat domain-containing protein [Terriglobales bacterium]
MKCEEIAQLLPDYLGRSLKTDKIKLVEDHIGQCAECGAEVAMWHKLSLIPDEQPSPMLRSRFDAMLNAYEEGKSEKRSLEAERRNWSSGWNLWSWMRAPLAQAAFALILLAAGFLVGRHFEGDHQIGNSNAQELAALHQELTSTRQLVALSMLQQQSASERLQGVNWSTRVGQPDPEILGALLHTLRYDASVDVRLAALDALRHFGDEQQVRSGLVDALPRQQSPLVQIALIDLLVELRDADAVQRLKTFEQTPNLNPAVRERLQWGVRQLSRG